MTSRKIKSYKRLQREYFIKLALVATGLLLFIAIVVSAAEPIKLTGHPTPEQHTAVYNLYMKRLEKMRLIGQAEINHKRELEIEVAKHQVALDLEAAGAAEINVSSNLSTSNVNNAVSRSEA